MHPNLKLMDQNYLNETIAEKQERQKCICQYIFRTSLKWQRISTLSSNEFYIILLIIRWFLYIDYLHILYYLNLYVIHLLLHHILIFKIHYSTRFSFLQITSLLTHEAVSLEKVFHSTKFLAFESQKFLSLKCFMKALKNSLVGI